MFISPSRCFLFQARHRHDVATDHNNKTSTIKEKIFDPFFTTKGDKGTGLGLTQVYGFVNRVAGAINVLSSVGHGSQIIIYFPRYSDATTTENTVDDWNNNNENIDIYAGTESILIVDDEKALGHLVVDQLSLLGYQPYYAEHGKQALQILGQEKIDLMLSDIIMPEMDGYQLAAIVQSEYPTVKIQLASGYSDDRHKLEVHDSLYKHILHKPYNELTLLKRIRLLLDKA